MNKDGHRYVKPIARTSAPSVLVCAVPVVRQRRGGRTNSTFYEKGEGCYLTIGRRIGTRWIGSDEPIYLTVEGLWDWVDAQCRTRGKLYVISPCASDFLTYTRFWEQCDAKRFRLFETGTPSQTARTGYVKPSGRWCARLVLRGSPDIVTARAKKGSLTFVSSSNFSHAIHSASSESERTTERLTAGDSAGQDSHEPNTKSDCRTLTRYFRRSITNWVERDNGTWRETIGQMAVSLWRRKFLTHKVCKHGDESASEIESACLHGGRADCWYFGDVGWRLSLDEASETPPPVSIYPTIFSAVNRYDVRSMYPALLRDCQFPVRLLSVEKEVDAGRVEGLCKHWGVLARVRLTTSIDEFPLRTNNRTIYPIGTFDTVLAGPELEYASQIGALRHVHALARYEMQPAFKLYAEYLLAERARLRAAGDAEGEADVKRLSNCFGGKFAQRSDRWEPRPSVVPPIQWGRWLRKDTESGLYAHYRVISGLAQERVTGRPGAGLLAAVFAYLTSYGRTQMRAIRQSLGAEAVISQDTDGLWLTDVGVSRLARIGKRLGGEPGQLREVDSHMFGRWYDAQHYYVGGRWTLSGFSNGFQIESDGTIVHTIECNPVRSFPGRAPGRVSRTIKRTRLTQIATVQRIGSDGWAKPPVTEYVRMDDQPPA